MEPISYKTKEKELFMPKCESHDAVRIVLIHYRGKGMAHVHIPVEKSDEVVPLFKKVKNYREYEEFIFRLNVWYYQL